VKIALDAMGGDLAPKANVEGAVAAARDFKIEIVLVGDRAIIEKELAECGGANLPISVVHASETVEMADSPLESVLGKPNSSMHVGYEMLKRGEVDGFLSAGNSGAMMTAAMVILGTLPGVDRPAIASLVPTGRDHAILIDAGANTEVKPFNLVEFAVMGSAYAHRVRKIEKPRVGILSNGEEDSKGNDLTRAAAATLRAMAPDINYTGYAEGRDINRGNFDVVVTDGFTGNVALKTMEGFAAFMSGNLRDLFGGNLRGRLAYLIIRKRLSAMRERLDPSEYGGAPLLGVNGVAIIAHGSSNARAIKHAIRAAADESLVRQVNAEIVEMLRKIPVATGPTPRPAGKGIRAIFSRMRERLHRHPRDGEDAAKNPSTGALSFPEAISADAPDHDTGSLAKSGASGSLAPSPNGTKLPVEAARHPQAIAEGIDATAPVHPSEKPVDKPAAAADPASPAKH
jgi:glycerol-3-phosphate acyltransferase PlsX